MRNWLALVLGVFAGLPVFAQGGDTRPQFEVAAIRECIGTEPRAALNASPGRLSVPCFGLFRLIQDAYQIFADGTGNFMNQPTSPTPIEGFPNQMSSYRYSIDAKAGSAQGMGMMRGPMLQRLLEDRFHLKIHRETRELPVYLMTVAKDGPRLQVTKEDSCDPAETADAAQPLAAIPGGKPRCGVLTPPTRNGSHFVLDERGIRGEVFAKLLIIGGLPVIDRTGLSGTFDIHLEWDFTPPDPVSPESGAASEPHDTSIISNIRKQLGLQLSPGKGPREFLVIDHLERPSEN
ncbi:exported hypothetical protein [Candidatus Sulfopaludibacter sp. SbA4]|nr:exported hypothetical protein [Candidatus Sulfopaludibacter sp. SbA4]